MYLLYLTPPMTGKTTKAQQLKAYFNADEVIELETLRTTSRAARRRLHQKKNVLVLATPEDDLSTLDGTAYEKLTNRVCNDAMVAVGGYPIWNQDGTRYKVKA
ncbi:hypothetical protein [Pseudomonas sp.]|uniref:hypothetical protein n=1 Tax=Pseudomonas sp. TaxID=306 RepID=UPI003FD7B700